MNQFLFRSHNLLTGQAAPFTGDSVPAAQARSMSAYIQTFNVSGNVNVKLGYVNPVASTGYILVYSGNFANNTTSHIALTGLPLPNIAAIVDGVTGRAYVTLFQQN